LRRAITESRGHIRLQHQFFRRSLSLHGGLFDAIALLDFGKLGYVVVGLFMLAWGLSVAAWKFGRMEERYGNVAISHCHTHTHDGGIEHSHEHLH
jgi:high-affinity nickel-transport protein